MRSGLSIALLLVLSSFASAAAEELSLGNGMLRYTPPPEPWKVQSVADHGTAVFYYIDHEATLLLSFVGNKAPRTDEIAEFTRQGIRDQLIMQFRQKNFDMIVEPTFVKDDRFFLVIHEQFRKEAQVHSQWHVYKNLPPHQFVATLLVAGDDKERLELLRKHAEDAILSGALVPKGQRAPPAPVMPKRDGAGARKGEVEAKKEVDAAIARVVAELEKKPAYQAALKRMATAEAKLKAERDREPKDAEAISRASVAWIEAKGPVESMKKEAIDSDAGVAESRRKLAEARKGK